MKIELPKRIRANDYHDFSFIVSILGQFGISADYEEIPKEYIITSSPTPFYEAIFYERGNKKSLEQFKKMIKAQKKNKIGE